MLAALYLIHNAQASMERFESYLKICLKIATMTSHVLAPKFVRTVILSSCRQYISCKRSSFKTCIAPGKLSVIICLRSAIIL